MNIGKIWKKRTSEHYKKISRYLKYVLNDHFVLVLIFLMGGLGYSYSEYIQTLSVDSSWIKEGIFLILIISIYFGKIATYIKEGDAVYLLPKEKEINETVLKHSFVSLILPSILLTIISLISLPILMLTSEITSQTVILLIITLILLKYTQLLSQLLAIKLLSQKKVNIGKTIIFLGNILVLYVLLYHSITVGLISSAAFTIISSYWIIQQLTGRRMNWEKAIGFEKTRIYSIYRFINLFTDVSIVVSKPKRRKYFDKLIKFFQKDSKNIFYYLYLRVFFRTQIYSGLYLRLVILTLGLLFLIDELLLMIIFSVISLYLIGFQLIPLVHYFDEQSLLKIYPVEQSNKIKALKTLLFFLLSFANSCFSVLAFLDSGVLEGISILIIGTLFNFFFVLSYTPKRLNTKMKREQ